MKKQFVLGAVVGGLVFGSAGVFAGQYVAHDNPFPVVFNDMYNAKIKGYNINDETYFKLRDVADVVGGFSVDFRDNVIYVNTMTYYPDCFKFAPDYSSMYGVQSIADSAMDMYSLYYNANCVDHLYPYDKQKVKDYEQWLQWLQCKKVYTYYDGYMTHDLFAKNGDYVYVEYGGDYGINIGVYPISEPDYTVITNPSVLFAKIDAAGLFN